MALETFDFPYHTVSTENPETGVRTMFGGSYIFSTPPTDPDQRKFTLSFEVMKFFTDENGILLDNVSEKVNMFTLIKFYQRHKLHKSFTYNHPVHGEIEVKFNKGLVEPESLSGGSGAVKSFSIELVEIP